jgi:hypothetical protein
MHSFARDLGWLVVFVERVLASPVQVEDSRPAESEDRLTRHVTCRVAFRLVGDFGGDFSSLIQLILFQLPSQGRPSSMPDYHAGHQFIRLRCSHRLSGAGDLALRSAFSPLNPSRPIARLKTRRSNIPGQSLPPSGSVSSPSATVLKRGLTALPNLSLTTVTTRKRLHRLTTLSSRKAPSTACECSGPASRPVEESVPILASRELFEDARWTREGHPAGKMRLETNALTAMQRI